MDLDEILIEEVRNHPLLYDLAHMEYKNLRRKDYAWKEVAANTKLSELECKKRWKSLRDSYKRCKRMDQLASGSSAETPRKKWRYFESLSFLENVSNSRRTIGSISADDTQFIEESEVVEIVDINSANISPPAIESPQSKVLNPREQKKKDSDKFQKFLEMAGSSISETCAAFVGQRQMQDSTALHFASLAAKISEAGLPPNTVNQIEAKVSVLVFGEIEKYLSASMESTVE